MGCPPMSESVHFHRGYSLRLHKSKPFINYGIISSSAPPVFTRGQLARSLSTFVPVFSKARGLHHQSSSWCARLSRAPTTTPHPPLPEASGFRWGLPYLLPTPLHILQEASRVHNEGLQQHAVGGVLLNAPSPLWGSP